MYINNLVRNRQQTFNGRRLLELLGTDGFPFLELPAFSTATTPVVVPRGWGGAGRSRGSGRGVGVNGSSSSGGVGVVFTWREELCLPVLSDVAAGVVLLLQDTEDVAGVDDGIDPPSLQLLSEPAHHRRRETVRLDRSHLTTHETQLQPLILLLRVISSFGFSIG